VTATSRRNAALHRLLTAARYRLSVSACDAKVRASLLKARSALSCCGILTTVKFLILQKQKTDPPLDSTIFRNGNAHLYRLGRESTPSNGSIR
jgi:hypothetical protein